MDVPLGFVDAGKRPCSSTVHIPDEVQHPGCSGCLNGCVCRHCWDEDLLPTQRMAALGLPGLGSGLAAVEPKGPGGRFRLVLGRAANSFPTTHHRPVASTWQPRLESASRRILCPSPLTPRSAPHSCPSPPSRTDGIVQVLCMSCREASNLVPADGGGPFLLSDSRKGRRTKEPSCVTVVCQTLR